ncbi:MAG TPA: porin [Blastocatellia bacterium]|nr:porin [Blastocatellia bacterium]
MTQISRILITGSFLLVAMFVPLALVNGQSVPAVPDKPAGATEREPGSRDESRAERSRDDEAVTLRSRVDQLEAIVEQQQRVLAEMQKRLDALQAAGPASLTPGAAGPSLAAAKPADEPGAPVTQAQAKADDKPSGVAGWNSHAFIRSADGSFETQIGGYAQLDYRGYQSGDHPPNTFLVRRARIGVEGKLQKYYDFRVEGDFADVVGTALRDFYVNIHRRDDVQFRFGQFRVPISQEEIRSDNLQDFVERSLVNNLAPSRSPGIGISGVIGKGVFEYQSGLFNGKGLLATNNNATPEAALRLRFAPWKKGESFWAKGLIFGGAVTGGRNLGGLSVRGITESRSSSFFVPDTVNGKYTRANAELTWLLGPAVIRAEYDQTNQSRDSLGLGGTNLPGVVAKGYTAQVTYLLTRETKPEAGILAPRRELFGVEGGGTGLGAWELKFRYANLQISDSTSKSNRAETFYFGPNWYLNRYVRYLLDIGYERFGDPLRAPRIGERGFFVVLSRVQVGF